LDRELDISVFHGLMDISASVIRLSSSRSSMPSFAAVSGRHAAAGAEVSKDSGMKTASTERCGDSGSSVLFASSKSVSVPGERRNVSFVPQ
jgi:hypothetical protein